MESPFSDMAVVDCAQPARAGSDGTSGPADVVVSREKPSDRGLPWARRTERSATMGSALFARRPLHI